MIDCLLFAARQRGGEDPALAVIGFVVVLVVAVIVIIREASARYDVTTRGGVPYCPRCNRQVTYRRDHCRSCGYQFKTYGDPASRAQPPAKSAAMVEAERLEAVRRDRRRMDAARLLDEKLRAEKQAAETARREEREKWYRARGIEPGPLAWFRAMPDVAQAVLIGLGIAVPVVTVLVMLFRGAGS